MTALPQSLHGALRLRFLCHVAMARLWRQMLLVVLMLLAPAAMAAPADITRASQWLQTRLAGGPAGLASAVATDEQGQCEAAQTLRALGETGPALAAAIAALRVSGDDLPTETLACARSLGRTDADSALQQRRLAVLSYNAYPGYAAASVPDSAWALLATGAVDPVTSRDALLQALATHQNTDGSFSHGGEPSVWTTALALRALTPIVTHSAQAADMATRAASWLLTRQSSAGVWADDLVLTAMAYAAVQPFSGAQPALADATSAWLLARQLPDGSWAGDTYVTAVVLRALALSGAAIQDPLKGSITMRFVDARTNAPLPAVSVTGAGSATGSSDSAGALRMGNVAAGSYTLVGSLAGFSSVSISLTLRAGQSLDLDVVQMLPAGGSTTGVVSGTVRDEATGQPLEAANVAIQGAGLSAATAPDGRYFIVGVTPGTVQLVVSKPGYDAATGLGRVGAGQVLLFSPSLSRSAEGTATVDCRVSGIVTNAGTTQPIEGAVVQVGGASSATVYTDAQGRYTVGGLSSGTLTLQVSRIGFDTANTGRQVLCSATVPVGLNYSPKLYLAGTAPAGSNKSSVSGLVMNASDNAPIAGANVTASSQLGALANTASGADGRFALAQLEADSVIVRVAANGFQTLTLHIGLNLGENQDLGQIRLVPSNVFYLQPDLKVLSVTRHTARTDPQSLELAGAVQVRISNGGTVSSIPNVPVIAFHDVNQDDLWTPGIDRVLGQTTLTVSLSPNQTAQFTVDVAGMLTMRDGPVHVIVDPASEFSDARRANNVRSTAMDSLIQPLSGQFAPALKHRWNLGGVMMTPVVGRIHDTNGDGVIDERDSVRIIFTDHLGRYDRGDADLVVLDGKSGQQVLRTNVANGRDSHQGIHGQLGIAIADIDGDGIPEIMVTLRSGYLAVLNNQGVLKWMAPGVGPYGIAVADISGDGRPAILHGRNVYNADGSLRFTMPRCTGAQGSYAVKMSSAATQHVVCGNDLYDHTGALVWSANLPTSWGNPMVVGSFLSAEQPEFLAVDQYGRGNVYLFDQAGALVWGPVNFGSTLGPITALDVDGDGKAEFTIASNSQLCLANGDGSRRWCAPVYDPSGQSGIAAFDFDGDGVPELVHRDTFTLRVFNALTGQVVFEKPTDFFWTAAEYPVVADVDADGHADIIMPGDSGRDAGIHVFQDVNNAWVATRSVWNQYEYHLTNINDDLSVPRNPTPSWQSHNTFRLNKRTDGDPRGVPDLTVGYARVADGGAQPSQVTWRLGNAGGYRNVAGASVALYANAAGGSLSLLATQSLPVLQPGQHTDLSFTLASLSAHASLTLVADDDGSGRTRTVDFDRSNNRHQIDLSLIATNLGLGVSTDKPRYSGTEIVAISAPVTNAGSFAKSTQVRFTILDAQGLPVTVLAPSSAITVGAGATDTVLASWGSEGVLAGNYQVLAELVTAQGVVYGQARADFGITASGAAGALNSASIRTDRPSYTAAQGIALSARVANHSGNAVQDNLQALTTVINAAGASVLSRSEPIAQLIPGAQRQYSYNLTGGSVPAGAYQARVQLLDAQGATLAQSSAGFVVQDSGQSGVGVTGQLQAQPQRVIIGQTSRLSLSVTNQGDATLGAAPVTVRLIDPVAGTVTAQFSADASGLQPLQSRIVSFDWSSQGLDGQTLVAAAVINIAGAERTLAQTNLTLVGEPRLQVRPGQLSFSAVPGASHTRSFDIVATGTAALGTLSVRLEGDSAAVFSVTGNGCTAASLAPGSACAVQLRYAPTAAGSHSATVVVHSANAGSASVALSALAHSVAPTGTISASPNPAPAGQSVSLLYAASNPAATTLSAQLSVSVRTSQGQSLQSWPVATGIGAQATVRGSVAYTAPASAQTLTVVLSAHMGGTDTVLSTASLVIQSPRSSVSAHISALNDARLLVLVACQPGEDDDDDEREYGRSVRPATEQLRSGSDDDDDDDDDDSDGAQCKSQRSRAIAKWLDALGVDYRIVTDEARFVHEMRCGRYNTYWVSGGALKLQEQTLAELREAHWRGAALWADGVHDARNKSLIDTLGLTLRGKLPQSNPQMSFVSGSPLGQGSLSVPGKAARMNTQGASAHAVFFAQGTGERVPAISTHGWGAGRSIAFAFELALLLDRHNPASSAAVRQMLTQALTLTRPNPATGVQVGQELALGIALSNPDSVARTLRVQAQVPAGLSTLGSSPPATAQAGGLAWTVSVPAGSQTTVQWSLRIDASGNQRITLQVAEEGASAGAPALLTRSFELSAPSPADVLTAAVNAVQSQSAVSGRDRSARDRALSDARSAQSLVTAGRHNDAAERWVRAIGYLLDISLDTRVAHDALSQALLVTQYAQCRSLRCLSGQLQASSLTPVLGSTVQLSGRLNNACSAAVDKVPMQLRLTNPRLDQTLLDETPRISVAPNASKTHSSTLRLKSPTRAGDELLLDLSIEWQRHRIPLDVLPLNVR